MREITNKELNKMSTAELRALLKENNDKLDAHEIDCSEWETLNDRVCCLLNESNWGKIYYNACRYCNNRGRNVVEFAREFANAVIDGGDYFPEMEEYEIESYYTKYKRPIVIKF